MAAAVKAKLSESLGRTTVDPELQQEAEKYRLIVTAGPSYDETQHKPVHVNTEIPTYIENDFIRAKITVRVRGFRGLPSSCPSTAEYFSSPLHEKDQYSLGFSFVPKRDLASLETVWGNDLDHPIRNRIPPGFNTAFRIAKELIDPGLSCDVYADEPWLYGPSLSCWFALRIGDEIADEADFPAPGMTMTEGADGSGQQVRDVLHLPDNNEKRRKHFLNAANREAFTFAKGRLYQGDFYNPYLDFANFALKLPGFSLKVVKYIGDKTHCLRYVFKNRQTGELYFNVNFKLLWGEQLAGALEDDARRQQERQGGEDDEERERGEEEERSRASNSREATSENAAEASLGAAPTRMQLHPGDHTALAESRTREKEVDEVDEIDALLKKTSTRQKFSGLHLQEQ